MTATGEPLNVKVIRQAAGFTQRQLAHHLGVQVRAIKRWEAGDRVPSEPYDAKLRALVATPPVGAPPAGATPRVELRLAAAVRLMGLRDDGHGRRSDRTLRNALKSGRLPGWKAPGYRAEIAEWCFYADDFERWRAAHYHPERDPRRDQAGELDTLLDTSTKAPYQGLLKPGVAKSGKIEQSDAAPKRDLRPRLAPKAAKKA